MPSLPWPRQGIAVTSAPTASQCPPSVAATLSFHRSWLGAATAVSSRQREEDTSTEKPKQVAHEVAKPSFAGFNVRAGRAAHVPDRATNG